ncbi:MAG: hypothetical protein OEQ13_09715, partial [Acidobacteriota bacterium]|nr:hypothetical protein [Acidobacteriota bacterium]
RACLARAGVGLGSAPLRAVAAPRALGYRYRARFQVDASRHPWRIGYHGAGSTRVVDAPGCPLLAPELDSVYRALRTWLPAGGPSGLSGLEIVTLPGHERGLVLLNPRDRAPSGWPACGERLLGALPDRVAGVSVRLPGRDARPELLGAPWLAGRTPAGHPVVAPAGGFLQANLAAADALGDVVVKAARADREPRCLELHAGSGLLSFRLAAGGARVTAIELDPRAVRAAEALPAPPRGQLSFACDDALGGRTPGRLRSVDVVVADPPRSGLGGLAAVLALSGPPRVVLVSCSTRTLAGDLARLTAGGYRLAELTVVDLFPQTRHLETVAVLVR